MYLRSWLVAALVTSCIGAVAACAPSETSEKVCTPGANVFCRCDDRREGTKRCATDGQSFAECKCTGSEAKSEPATKTWSSNTEDSAEDTSMSGSASKPGTASQNITASDAGEPSGPTTSKSSFICTRLQACCDAQRRMGITGSADQCDRSVATGDDHACQNELTLSALPDDFYDPPAECR